MGRLAAAHSAADARPVHGVPHAAQSELLVDLRRHPHLHARVANRDRRRARHALRGHAGRRFRQHRAPHARRELGMALALHPCRRCLDVLPRRLYPHSARPLLRLLQGAARSDMDPRRIDPLHDDRHRLHGLFARVGADELLGDHGHHQFLLIARRGGPWHRHAARGMDLGGFAVGGPSLTRLYSLHYLFPFLIAGVVVLHIWALHIPGNNNPSGIDVKSPRETIPFHPDNYIPANPLQTPAHIVPEWYFLPFYAILRAIPSKLFGVAALIGSIAILFFVPWLDTSRVRSTSYRPIYKWFFWAFVLTCFVLGYLGSQPPEGIYLVLGRMLTAYYFLFFLLVMPVVGWIEKPKALPGSITESVLGPEETPSASPRPAPRRRTPEPVV